MGETGERSAVDGRLEADEGQLVELPSAEGCTVRVLPAVARAFLALSAAARDEGVELVAVSGHRSIERQRAIWQRKFAAARADGLDEPGALAKVMEYSAPPGWSRHHWGTDLDLVCGALATTPRLEPEDWEPGGPCAGALAWLERRAGEFGFVRPYDEDRGGYRVEPWHWSHAPHSVSCLRAAAAVDWASWFREAGFDGARLLADDAAVLCKRYVLAVAPALR